MDFIVDESTGTAVVEYVRSVGHDVLFVAEAMPHADDPDILDRVVCDGMLLFACDDATRIEFETTTRDEYFDYLRVHRQLQEAFFADLRKRGLHG